HGETAGKVAAMVGAAHLVGDAVARTACARSTFSARFGVGIASLGHEVGEYTMELGAVVEALLSKRDEVRDMIRRVILEELNDDQAATLNVNLHHGQIVRLRLGGAQRLFL